MMNTKTSMDAASYALWQELRAPNIRRLKPKAIYGTACCLLWLTAGLLFGQVGLLSLVLVWFALYLPIGIAHFFCADAKDDWHSRFTPSFYLLSPLIGFFILFGQVMGMFRGRPFIPTILTGKNLVSISQDSQGYRFTMNTGRFAVFVRDEYEPHRFHLSYSRDLGGVVGPIQWVVMDLDEGLQDASASGDS